MTYKKTATSYESSLSLMLTSILLPLKFEIPGLLTLPPALDCFSFSCRGEVSDVWIFSGTLNHRAHVLPLQGLLRSSTLPIFVERYWLEFSHVASPSCK